MEASKATMSKEDIKELLDVEKLKNCFECGICTASCSMAELLGKDYNPRNLLEKILLNPDDVLLSDEPWLCAWCYQCYKRCPQGLRLPEIFLHLRIAAIKNSFTKPLENALEKIFENVALPIVTTLVCFHPERAGLDMNKILELTEQINAQRLKREKRKKKRNNSGKKVAVIGSGPSGLTVASELAKKGHQITIFEASSETGGMLRKCIPEYRLPKEILDREIQFIKDLGVEIKTGVKVGKDIGFDDLTKDNYKAIFVGVGADKNQELKIEGADLKGVIHALEFLWNVNCGRNVEVGKDVIVVGGGNVAMDAARIALKSGAEHVSIVYRRSREEMPAIPWEIDEAEADGVKIEYLVAPKRFLGENGKVSAVECVRMLLGEPDESGRRKPTPIEGSEFTCETDMVILAVGEVPNLDFLPNDVELDEEGTVWVNPITMETSVKGVFAGGDAVSGPATVIEAICAGKRAAKSIENYLSTCRE